MKKILAVLFFSLSLEAATYTFPDDLLGLGCLPPIPPFSTSYTCVFNLTFNQNDIINVTSDTSIVSGASFLANNRLTINTGSNTLDMEFGGVFTTGTRLDASNCVNVTTGGDITIGNQGSIAGTLQSNAGTVNLGMNTVNTPCSISPPVTDLSCSAQMGEGTINEIYKVGNSNFFEVKVFDPFTTSYADWSLLYCDEGVEFGSCVNFLDVPDMTQTNVYWFLENDIPGFDDLNSNSKFTLFLVDGSNNLIDMLVLNGSTLGSNTNVDCTFLYDTTADTTSSSKAIARNPDGIGDWGDSGGAGNPTDNTPGDNNNGVPTGISSEYRMDECLWDGSADEVLDSSGNSYHGYAVNGAITEVESQMERSGYFDGVDDYIEQANIYDNLKSTASLSFWIKTTQASPFANAQRSPGVIGIEDNGGTDDIFWGWIDNTGRINVQKGNNKGPKSIAPINDNVWHHIVLTRAVDGKHCNLYVDGVFNNTNDTSPGVVGNSFNRIGSMQDTDGTHTYFEGHLDELKSFSTILSPGEIQNVYTNELAKNNYDGSARAPVNCGGGVVPKDGNYTAVDLVTGACSAQSHWNNNLQTKIVNDNINLSILALDKATDLPLEANITKVSLVHYSSGNNIACTGASLSSVDLCTNCGLTDINGCLSLSIDKGFNQRASRCVEVLIQGKDKDDTLGTSLSDSNASDNFSIRPEMYSCDGIAIGTLVAEHSYASTFTATPLDLNIPSQGYNTSSVSVRANKYMRTGDLNGSLSGSVSPGSLVFNEGNASADIIFNDVGDIGIDINDSTWADVDSDDTAEADRVVHTECRRLFRPDHFTVILNRPSLENNATTGFTYLSNLSPGVKMSAWMKDLNTTIIAQGENNATLVNYKDPSTSFYANEVSLYPLLTLPAKHSAARKQIDLVDQNSSDITDFIFINGVASHRYDKVGFNYDRDYHNPITPFSVDGNESFFRLRAEDRLYPSVVGEASTDSDNSVSFYYGRLRSSDLITTFLPSNSTNFYEVYDNTNSSYTLGMKQTSISWYINNLHDDNNEGNISEATASNNSIIDDIGYSFSYNPVVSGKENLSINTSTASKATIHLKTQQWLWYVPSGFGSAYADTAGTDCTEHPCFKFTLVPNNTALKIESGDFNGTVVPDVNRSDYIKKGVKLFR